MPCPSAGPKTVCALSIFLVQAKDRIPFSAAPKTFVPVQKLMPCPFTGPKIFCARPKIYLHIVAVTNILCQTKR